MTSAAFALLPTLFAGAQAPAQAPPPPPAAAAAEPAVPGETGVPAGPGARGDDADGTPGPTPGAPTITLAAAVRSALARNFGVLDAADALAGARWNERSARAAFLPRPVPYYRWSDEGSSFGVDLAQSLPWLGGTLSAGGQHLRASSGEAPLQASTALRVLYSQPLLRGFGPNASLFTLRSARRALHSQERTLALARQDLAIGVAAAFYAVIAQRQLLDVAGQSLARSEALLGSSAARLEVGMASKLDVFRAELQLAQARDGVVRAEASLATALERFRGLLALPAGDPLEPDAHAPPQPDQAEAEPLEALLRRAHDGRLELAEARELLAEARRTSSLARQELLPQLDVNVALTRSGYGSSFGGAWSAGDNRVDVFLSTSYPLQQTDARANRALAELRLGSRERAVTERELEVEQEVRQALRTLEQLRKSVLLQRRAVEVAAQQRRLAVMRYERGLGGNFDVVDAEASLVAARSALVQSLTGWAVARLELKRATGSLDPEAEFAP